MLFMITQTHGPKECPLNDENCKPLFDTSKAKVKIKGMYANPPAHTFYFIIESDSFEEIQKIFMDGMTRSVVTITPVMEMK